MESDILQTPQETLYCFICQGIFLDPVLLRCGHTFCNACLILSSEDIGIPDLCPICRQPTHRMFINNITMRNLVSAVRENRLMMYLSSEEHKCETQRRERQNSVLKLEKQMTSLWEKVQEQENYLWAQRRTIVQWSHYVTLWEEMIRTAYSKLYPPLNEEENQHIECMKNQSNTILEELRKTEALMVHKRSHLIEVYQELMAMSQKPCEMLLLQDLDDLFRRSELVQLSLMTQDMKPKLSAHPNTGLTARFSCFQEKISFQNLIVFNCNPSLVFDVRRVTSRPYYEDPFLDLAGSCRASWGAESFTTGKHYWELDLKDYEQWTVGVCNNDWLKEGNYEIGSEGAFLLVYLKEDDHYSLLTTCPTFHHYIEKPAGRVGVFLDCEGGCVSFLDVAKSSLIYSYCPGTFHCPVRPFFSTVCT